MNFNTLIYENLKQQKIKRVKEMERVNRHNLLALLAPLPILISVPSLFILASIIVFNTALFIQLYPGYTSTPYYLLRFAILLMSNGLILFGIYYKYISHLRNKLIREKYNEGLSVVEIGTTSFLEPLFAQLVSEGQSIFKTQGYKNPVSSKNE